MAGGYDAESKERAVKLLADSRGNYSSETRALEGVAKNLGITTESLRRWRSQVDMAHAADPGESEELKRLRRGNEIPGSASAFS